MRDLDPAFLAAAGATVKAPLWLVQIDYDPVVRLCSWGDVAYGGDTWAGADLRVDGIDSAASGEQAGSLTLGNVDLVWSALVLGESIADRPVRIWQSYLTALSGSGELIGILGRGGLLVGYLDATTAGVLLPVFSGVADEASIGMREVRLTLASGSSRRAKCPREFGGDFSIVQPAGLRIPFNNEVFELVRE